MRLAARPVLFCLVFAAIGLGPVAAAEAGHPVPHASAVVSFADMMRAEARLMAQGVRTNKEIDRPHPVPEMPLTAEEQSAVNAMRGFPPVRQSELAPAPAAPVLGTNFLGLDDSETAIPPDTDGAVGPNHLVTMLNSQVRILNRTGGTLSTVSLNGFWSAVTNGSGAFDPHIVYDAAGGRWIATAAYGDRAQSVILLGASDTNDPTGTWHLHAFLVDATSVNWLDYPGLGYNSTYVTVTGNMYSVANDTFDGVEAFVFNKTNLYAGNTNGVVQSALQTGNSGSIKPAQTLDAGVSTIYGLQNWNGPVGTIRLTTINPATGVFTGVTTPISTNGVIASTSTWASFPATDDFAPQLGISSLLSTGDSRMADVVLRNGKLWTAHTVFLPTAAPTHAGIQWWVVGTNGTVVQNAVIQDATGAAFYAYPSIAVNSAEHVVIGHSIFSSTIYASGGYSYRAPADPLNTMRAPQVFKAGIGPYLKTFGGPSNRWGDYSKTMVDPSSDADFWTLQEFAAAPGSSLTDPGNFGVWWAKITQETLTTGSARFDFNGDGKSDVILRNSVTGDIAEYQMNGTSILSAVIVGNAGTAYSVATMGDYNGDGKADLVLQNTTTNDIALWLMNGNALVSGVLVGNPGAGWKAVGSGDFNGDGKADIVLYNTTNGNIAVWLMNGGTITSGAVLGTPGTAYAFVAAADFNGDGKADVLLQNTSTGDMAVWLMNGVTITGGLVIGGAGASWKSVAAADTNGDGKADIFLRNQTTGDIALWQMNGFTILSGMVVGSPGSAYAMVGAADYNGDGKADILLRNTNGDVAIWLLNGGSITGGAVVATPGSNWVAVAK